MTNIKKILSNRLSTLEKHIGALSSYYQLIQNTINEKDIYDIRVFPDLEITEKAVLDAYLKRFSSVQDYLGAKIFPLLAEINGVASSKMSEIILQMEKEEVIDSFESWINLREIRNALEHEYAEELEEALNDLKTCVDSFSKLETYYYKTKGFIKKIYPDFQL